MMSKDSKKIERQFSETHQEVLRSIRGRRIILPLLIGLSVVGWLFWRRFDPQEFHQISWSGHVIFWIAIAICLLILRHLAYATRLRILSQGAFSWRKCIELIFIWEFSSAVSPTSLGGSAVAFFVLAQERLPLARTATIVLYTIVLDTFFFVSTLPILFLLFGTHMIRPQLHSLTQIDAWGYYFIFAYVLMATYGAAFFYGLFVSPYQMKRLLVSITHFPFFRRFRAKAVELGNDLILASNELRLQPPTLHLSALLSTIVAWSFRFLLLNCLIIAFVPEIPRTFWAQFELYARLETMFVIIAFSPTPGGAGFVEVLFGGFLTDYIRTSTKATIISTLWRLLTYYSYLIAGAFIVPNWLQRILIERRQRRKQKDAIKIH